MLSGVAGTLNVESRVVVSLDIRPDAIQLQHMLLWRRKSEIWPLSDTDLIYSSPSTAGAYYSLHLKRGKKVALMNLATGPWRDKKILETVNARLEEVTGLRVLEGDKRA